MHKKAICTHNSIQTLKVSCKNRHLSHTWPPDQKYTNFTNYRPLKIKKTDSIFCGKFVNFENTKLKPRN